MKKLKETYRQTSFTLKLSDHFITFSLANNWTLHIESL